jgi:hypothetical protein
MAGGMGGSDHTPLSERARMMNGEPVGIPPAEGSHSTPQTPTHRGVHPRAEHAMVIDPGARDAGPRKGLLLWWLQQGTSWFGHVVFVDAHGAVRQESVPADLVRQLGDDG